MAIEQVYMIRHNVTGRMYIGRSKQMKSRVAAHFYMLRAGRHPVEDMQKDFNEYGNDFTVSVLGEVNNGCLRLETEMMDKYQSTIRGIGYNYNDPHVTKRISKKKCSTKTKIRKLVDTLDDDEALYAYTLLSKIFGNRLKTDTSP